MDLAYSSLPLGVTTTPKKAPAAAPSETLLFRLSDSSGKITFTPVPGKVTYKSLDPKDTFLVDASSTVFVWIGSQADALEKRLSLQYAQNYLWQKPGSHARVNIVKVAEDHESKDFLEIVGA